MTYGCNHAFEGITSGFAASWDPEKLPSVSQTWSHTRLISDSHKRKDDLRFDGSSEGRGRRELRKRHHFANPAIHLRTLRSGQNFVIDHPSLIADMSLDCERFVEVLFVARDKAQHRRICRVHRLV